MSDPQVTDSEELESVSPSYDIVDPLEFFPQIPNSTRALLHRETDFQTVLDVLVQHKLYAEKQWRFSKIHVLNGSACVIPEPSIEQKIATLFNEIFKAAVKTNPDAWRSHAESTIQGIRKPDVVLVKRHKQHEDSVEFGDIITYCELKAQSDTRAVKEAWRQIAEMTGFVVSRQAHRRFFIGLSLCGDQLRLMMFARGAVVSSRSFNINDDPLLFIKVLLNLSCVDSVSHGFDDNFIDLGQGNFELDVGDLKVLVTPVKLFHSLSIKGRGTKVSLCSESLPEGKRYYVVKDCWLVEGPTDIDIHNHLKFECPSDFTNAEEDSIFGKQDKFDIFRGCLKTTTTSIWDYDVNLPGIPIIAASEIPHCRNPSSTPRLQDSASELRCADTTQHILSRFTANLSFEARTHIRVLSATCGTSLAWFSCRREFLNGLMGAIAGHFNGLRKNMLHCDISDTNVWFIVPDLDPRSVVPDWPQDGAYTKRAGVLGDWGLAEIRDPSQPNDGTVTGTYPFLAAELLSAEGLAGKVRHEVHHDLESFFWLLWIMCVNLNGPFLKRQLWSTSFPNGNQNPSTQSPSLSRRHTKSSHKPSAEALRHPCDADTLNAELDVPAWATPGLHSCTAKEVHGFKFEIPYSRFLLSLSPYFCLQPIIEGLEQLREHFAPTVDVRSRTWNPPKKRITHTIFIQILQNMRDSITPGDDCPTEQDIIRGRQSYESVVKLGRGFDVPVMQEVTPVLSQSTSKGVTIPSQSRSTSKGVTVSNRRQGKRKATEDPQDIPTPNQRSSGRVKRQRT